MPITDLFGNSARYDEYFGEVLRIIDKVHMIGPVSGDLVTVVQTESEFKNGRWVLGRLRKDENKLFYNPTRNNVPGTLVHETGHGLDWRVFGDGKYYGSQLAATGRGPLAGWFEAVKKTQAYRDIEDVRL